MRGETVKLYRDRRGSAYIYLCVIVLFISALLSVLLLYMGLTAQVRMQKREVQSKLDGCLISFAAEAFDALKQGDRAEEAMDTDRLTAECYAALGFARFDTVYTETDGGCRMSRPDVTVWSDDGFGVTVTYTATFPVRWNGKNYDVLTIPVSVTSCYHGKGEFR